jgi:hypothetical protein
VLAARARALCAVAVLLLTACQATVNVGIDAHHDGSGQVVVTVTLDQEAAQTVPDLANQLRTGDLGKAGWRIDGPTPTANHGVAIRATHPFRDAADAARVVDQLSGTGQFHPFQGFTLARHHSLLSTRTTFRGKVDLSCGLRCFGDQQLQQTLGSSELGFDPAQFQQLTGVILDRIFQFQVSVRLPGSLTSSNAPTQVGNGAVWSPKLGQTAALSAGARQWDTRRLVLLAVAGLLCVALVVLLLRSRQLARRRPLGRHGRRF